METKHNKIMLAMAVLGIAFLAAKPFIHPVPLVIWNASESVPIGLYFVAKRQPKIADLPQNWWTPIIRSIETVEVFYENEENVYGRIQG